jgi:hypothetical protein
MPMSDEKFQERLSEGKKFEKLVVDALVEEGFDPEWSSDDEVLPDRNIAAYAKFDADIIVDEAILEVKSRRSTCKFTGPEDFPFDDIFLETKSGWEAKEFKPDFYVVVSQCTGGMLVVDGKTREQWDSRRVWDRNCGYASETLVAPKDLARPFSWMVDELRNCS